MFNKNIVFEQKVASWQSRPWIGSSSIPPILKRHILMMDAQFIFSFIERINEFKIKWCFKPYRIKSWAFLLEQKKRFATNSNSYSTYFSNEDFYCQVQCKTSTRRKNIESRSTTRTLFIYPMNTTMKHWVVKQHQ